MNKIKSTFKMTLSALICGMVFINCGGSGNKTADGKAENNDTIVALDIASVKLEPLKDETLRLKGKDPFGQVIELRGEQIVVDDLIFKPSEIEMVIKGNLMIMQSRSSDGMFALLSLPDLQYIKSFGKIGGGPDEFMYPHLCKNTEPDILATIVESTNGKIYDVLTDGSLKLNNINIPKVKSQSNYAGEYPALMTDTLLYFSANSSTGKSVFTIGGTDNIQVNEIQNLALDPRRKGWANYIGDFAINVEQSRMVYAYKYFKLVRFFDLENHTVRTINYEREEFDESSQYVINGLDANVTHYWGISANDKYVYMLYSGRTPMQVGSDNNKRNYYIHVEKYDWNGQPIAKYKLDRWGYFTVDEKNNILYLVSTNDDSSFFKYQL
jgi:catabolite regulation protein CreA